jgi:hypothetical protein
MTAYGRAVSLHSYAGRNMLRKHGDLEMKRLSLLICILSLGAANAFASVTGSIVGTVTDATGGMNTGTTVTATNVEARVKVTANADAAGAYRSPELNIGHHELLVQATGFAGLQEKESSLDVNAHLLAQTNPRNGGTYFNMSLFTVENPGQFGNAKRRFIGGSGLNNWERE